MAREAYYQKRDSMTPEQAEERRKLAREGHRLRRAGMSVEQIDGVRKRSREEYRRRRARMTPEQVERTNKRVRDYHQKFRGSNYEVWRKSRLKHRYKLTAKQWDVMFESQQGRCALCLQTSDRTLHVDHDHDTGKVRALLCWHCNRLLGKVEKYPELVRAMFIYLDVHKCSK